MVFAVIQLWLRLMPAKVLLDSREDCTWNVVHTSLRDAAWAIAAVAKVANVVEARTICYASLR